MSEAEHNKPDGKGSNRSDERDFDDVLRKMLNTPPKPHKEQKQKKEKPAK